MQHLAKVSPKFNKMSAISFTDQSAELRVLMAAPSSVRIINAGYNSFYPLHESAVIFIRLLLSLLLIILLKGSKY
jgi:hypothetical protein